MGIEGTYYEREWRDEEGDVHTDPLLTFYESRLPFLHELGVSSAVYPDKNRRTIQVQIDNDTLTIAESELKHFDELITSWFKVAKSSQAMRTFESGATRSSEAGKLNYTAFLAPEVLRRYAEYLDKHSMQADGQKRPGDNWKKGIPQQAYMESLHRHFMEFWELHNASQVCDDPRIYSYIEDAACAILFNTMGYLFEILKKYQQKI